MVKTHKSIHSEVLTDNRLRLGKSFCYVLVFLSFLGVNSMATAQTQQEQIIYVSTNGNDGNTGTLDAPLQTLQKAKSLVRELKEKEAGPIKVLIRGGVYQLTETVVFDLEDSGDKERTITYESYPGETPVFSGGEAITGWKKVAGALEGLPEAAIGNVWEANVSASFRSLFDDEGILPRAQSDGFITAPGKNGKNQVNFPEGEMRDWSNMTDVEVLVRPHHAWITNLLPLSSVDERNNIATTSLRSTYSMNKLHFLPKEKNVWVENALDFLDKPGEWVLNTKEQKVYLWRRNDSPVIRPILNELIKVEGDINFRRPTDVPVENLHFRGLTFMHGERYQLTDDDKGLQHDWDMLDKDNALFRFRGTENCVIDKCHFLNSGSGAIRVDLHGIENVISNNHIENMGGGGILLAGYGPGKKDVNKKNTVYNNDIHHVGEIYWHSPGIFIWQSGENKVANNLIHHTNYTALIVSGFMDQFFKKKGDNRELVRTVRRNDVGMPREMSREEILKYLHSKNNIIEYNEIHHSMLKLGDGNAIYIRGANEGNIIRRNYIHDMVGETLMQAAIRTDGGQTGTLIAENVLYRCTSQGILTKLNNSVVNNVVVDVIAPPRGYYLSVREGPLTGAEIKKNIFYTTTDSLKFIDELPPGKGRTSEDRRGRTLARVMDADTDYNIYFSSVHPEKGKQLIDKNQKNKVDLNSQSVDPLFVDVRNGDFRFQPGSPALEMGIAPLDVSEMGLRKHDSKKP